MKRTGVILAATVGALFATASFAADNHANNGEANVKCVGGNACKGQSACKGASSSCKGQNNCKGTGYTMVKSEKECTDMGGKVEAAK